MLDPCPLFGLSDKLYGGILLGENTYYLPFTELHIPREDEHDKRDMVTYYQWVPFILLAQALFFHLPCSIWRNYNKRCGVDVADFVERSQALPILEQVQSGDFHEKTLCHLASTMSRFVANQKSSRNKRCTLSVKHICSATCLRSLRNGNGRYLVSLYLACKLLYLANALGQLFSIG